MRLFGYDDVREQRVTAGDALTDRWRARDARGRDLTLLRLKAEHAASDAVCFAWLEQCARNHALDVPGVVPLYDYGMHAGQPYASRDAADDSVPLSAVLQLLQARGELLPQMLAVHVVLAIATCLAAAHGCSRPLYHGDLHAGTVRVRGDGRVQLEELGFWCALPPARAFALRTSGGVPEHFAPELASGAAPDARSDLFALGVLFRRMLVPEAGQAPGKTRVLIPTAPPPALTMVLARLLAPAPESRAADMEEVRRVLTQVSTHTAGAAALAQLNADVRGATRGQAEVPARSSLRGSTELFIKVPSIPPPAPPPPPEPAARGGTGGFRVKTQIIGTLPVATAVERASSLSTNASPDAPPAPASSAPAASMSSPPAASTPEPFATRQLRPDELPPLLPPVEHGVARDSVELPALLSVPPPNSDGISFAGVGSQSDSQALLDGPPLLTQPGGAPGRATSASSFDASPQEYGAGSELIHAAAALARSREAGRMPSEPPRSHSRRLTSVLPIPRLSDLPEVEERPSEVRKRSPDDEPPSLQVPGSQPAANLAEPAPAILSALPKPLAPELSLQASLSPDSDAGPLVARRRRPPPKDPSATVVGIKARSLVRSSPPEDRPGSKRMFVVAMLLASLVVLALGLLARLVF